MKDFFFDYVSCFYEARKQYGYCRTMGRML